MQYARLIKCSSTSYEQLRALLCYCCNNLATQLHSGIKINKITVSFCHPLPKCSENQVLQLVFTLFCSLVHFKKNNTRAGVAPQVRRENKEAVADEDEELFWRNGLFGQSTANSLIIVFMFTWNDFWFKGRGALEFKLDKF